MLNKSFARLAAVILCMACVVAGCKKETPPSDTASVPNTSAAPAAEVPPAQPAAKESAPAPAPTPAPASPTATATPAPAEKPVAPTDAPKAAPGGTTELVIQGLALTIPADWVVEPFQPSAMSGTVAAYRLSKAEGDSEDAILKFSHFPGMKGKDADNVTRWLGQVVVDGKPISKEAANFKVEEMGNVRLTTMDAAGAISTSMMGGGAATPGQRMISAIIDHPQGPHFLKVAGAEKTIAKWRDSIYAVMKSAKAK